MKSIWSKIKNHYTEYGFIKTITWLFNCVYFKLINQFRIKRQYESIKLTKNEKESCVLKTQKQVFIFGTVPFYDIGGGQRSAQFAKTFNKMGYKVQYIFAFDSSEATQFTLNIPANKHLYIGNYPSNTFANDLKENDMVIFEAPCKSFQEYLNVAAEIKCKIVYENIDNWESNLGSILFDEETLKLMLRKASILTGTAKPLVSQLENYLKKYKLPKNKILYLPNAVDDELFNGNKKFTKPNDLITGEKTLIYYGSLWGAWFDWELVFDIAKKYPTYSIILIGDNSGIQKIVEKSPKNIYFLGMKKQDELPNYLAYCDYAILPFKVDEVGEYVSPLKVFEYIAMNKLVLATKLPDIMSYPNVYCGNTSKNWIQYIQKELKNDVGACQKFIADNNWYNRCVNLIDALNFEEKKAPKEFYNNISVVTLNYNNANVIFRCVDTLLKNNERYNYEIIVVDNQSSDGSYEELKKQYKDNKSVKILRNSKNGCSSGRNLGVKNASKDYIVFLDSDEWILHKYWLDNYIDIYTKDLNVGAIGWGAGWFNKKGFAYHVVDSYAFRYMPPCCLTRPDIGYLATCGFLISKKLFNEIEGFDEAYDPTCYEDTDLSLKVRNSGKEIYYSPYLGVGHLPHQTTKSGSAAHEKLITEKGIYFIDKWSKINKDLILKYKK